MLELAQPWALLLVPLPLLVYLLPPYRQRQASLQVPYFDRLVALSPEPPRRGASVVQRMHIQGVVAAIGWLLLCGALAKPEWVGPPVEVERSARDLMIALDLSGSMDKDDFTSSEGLQQRRIDAARDVLREFAARRDGDR